MTYRRVALGGLFACILFSGSCEAPAVVGGKHAGMPFVVTEAERKRAMELVEGMETVQALSAEGRLYLVGIEVLRAKDETGREILITQYRTEGDLAILSRVNLDRGTVVSVSTNPHLPVRLSEEEFEIARDLALDDPQVKTALADRQGVRVEAQVSRTFDESDPLYGHRVVHLLFRTPEGYLESPSVIVDLTTREVVIEEPRRRAR